jgi:Lamin Tail Domain
MKRRQYFSIISSLVAVFVFCVSAQSASPDVVISQFYSSQVAKGRLQYDFIELFNRSDTAVDLSGWSLQASEMSDGFWKKMPLSGTIGTGQYLLISGALTVTSGGLIPLPPVDASGDLMLNPTAGRLALVNDTVTLGSECPAAGAIVDFVYWGSTGCGTIDPFDGKSSLIRALGGCADSDDVAADFSFVSPYPRSKTEPRISCDTPTESARYSFNLPANGGAAKTTSGAGAITSIGSARFQSSDGAPSPNGMAIFSFRQGGTLVSEATVPASTLVRSAIVYVEYSGSVNTGLAITNPNSDPVTISFDYVDSSRGYYFPSNFGTLTIPANGQIARFINQLPFAMSAPLQGTLELYSTAPIGITALRGYTNERNEFLVTTLPVIDSSTPPPTTPTVLAQFAVEGGWRTYIYLVNSGTVEATGSIDFRNPSGQLSPVPLAGLPTPVSSATYSIPARSSLSVLLKGTGLITRTGSVRISPSGGTPTPVAMAVFGYRRNDVVVSEAGLVGITGSQLSTYVEASGAVGAIGSVQSGLAIANAGDKATVVDLTLTPLDGTTSGTLRASLTLNPFSQLSRSLNELFPTLPTSFQGVLHASTPGSITMVGLRARYNERGDYLFTTTPPVDESAPASFDELIFPHLTDSGGYKTQFFFFGSSATATAGTLMSLNPAGLPLALQLQ